MHRGQKKLIRRLDISKGETVFTTLIRCRFYLGAQLSFPMLERHKQQQNSGLIQWMPFHFFFLLYPYMYVPDRWLCVQMLLIKAVDPIACPMVGVSGPLDHSLEWNLRVAFIDWWGFSRLGAGTMRSTRAQLEKRSRVDADAQKEAGNPLRHLRFRKHPSTLLFQSRSSCQLAHCERRGN